jgi:peptidyl-prolyl cis-trans isomerase SurA
MGSAAIGGETGFRSKIELAPEYATAAFALNDPKRISNVVQTEYGYHIIQLIEKKGDRINTRHVLLRPKVSEQDIEKALTRLDTLLTDINAGKISFEEATLYVSTDKDTKDNNGLMVNKNEQSRNYGTPKFEMEELPQGMGVIVDKLKVGEISKPFKMKNSAQNDVVAIVRLKSRVNVHQANIQDDFLELKTLVEGIKREEIIKDWIVSKQKSTYIRVSEGWRDCDFKYPGWIKE